MYGMTVVLLVEDRRVPYAVAGLARAVATAADLHVPIPSARAAGDDRITVASVCLPPERLGIDVSEDAQPVTVTALDDDSDNRQRLPVHQRGLPSFAPWDRRPIDGATGNEVLVECR